MSRLIKFSRVKHHKGKSARFRVRWCCRYSWRNRYPLHYRAAFAFSLICCPHRHRCISRCTFPLRGAMWIYPVPLEWRDRLGLFYTPAVLFTHDRVMGSLCAHCKKSRAAC